MTFLPFLVPASRRFFSSASSGKREDLLSGPVFSWRPSFSPLSFSLPPYSAHTFPDPFAAPKGGHLAVQPRPSRMVGRDSSKQLRDALLQPSTLPVAKRRERRKQKDEEQGSQEDLAERKENKRALRFSFFSLEATMDPSISSEPALPVSLLKDLYCFFLEALLLLDIPPSVTSLSLLDYFSLLRGGQQRENEKETSSPPEPSRHGTGTRGEREPEEVPSSCEAPNSLLGRNEENGRPAKTHEESNRSSQTEKQEEQGHLQGDEEQKEEEEEDPRKAVNEERKRKRPRDVFDALEEAELGSTEADGKCCVERKESHEERKEQKKRRRKTPSSFSLSPPLLRRHALGCMLSRPGSCTSSSAWTFLETEQVHDLLRSLESALLPSLVLPLSTAVLTSPDSKAFMGAFLRPLSPTRRAGGRDSFTAATSRGVQAERNRAEARELSKKEGLTEKRATADRSAASRDEGDGQDPQETSAPPLSAHHDDHTAGSLSWSGDLSCCIPPSHPLSFHAFSRCIRKRSQGYGFEVLRRYRMILLQLLWLGTSYSSPGFFCLPFFAFCSSCSYTPPSSSACSCGSSPSSAIAAWCLCCHVRQSFFRASFWRCLSLEKESLPLSPTTRMSLFPPSFPTLLSLERTHSKTRRSCRRLSRDSHDDQGKKEEKEEQEEEEEGQGEEEEEQARRRETSRRSRLRGCADGRENAVEGEEATRRENAAESKEGERQKGRETSKGNEERTEAPVHQEATSCSAISDDGGLRGNLFRSSDLEESRSLRPRHTAQETAGEQEWGREEEQEERDFSPFRSPYLRDVAHFRLFLQDRQFVLFNLCAVKIASLGVRHATELFVSDLLGTPFARMPQQVEKTEGGGSMVGPDAGDDESHRLAERTGEDIQEEVGEQRQLEGEKGGKSRETNEEEEEKGKQGKQREERSHHDRETLREHSPERESKKGEKGPDTSTSRSTARTSTSTASTPAVVGTGHWSLNTPTDSSLGDDRCRLSALLPGKTDLLSRDSNANQRKSRATEDESKKKLRQLNTSWWELIARLERVRSLSSLMATHQEGGQQHESSPPVCSPFSSSLTPPPQIGCGPVFLKQEPREAAEDSQRAAGSRGSVPREKKRAMGAERTRVGGGGLKKRKSGAEERTESRSSSSPSGPSRERKAQREKDERERERDIRRNEKRREEEEEFAIFPDCAIWRLGRLMRSLKNLQNAVFSLPKETLVSTRSCNPPTVSPSSSGAQVTISTREESLQGVGARVRIMSRAGNSLARGLGGPSAPVRTTGSSSRSTGRTTTAHEEEEGEEERVEEGEEEEKKKKDELGQGLSRVEDEGKSDGVVSVEEGESLPRDQLLSLSDERTERVDALRRQSGDELNELAKCLSRACRECLFCSLSQVSNSKFFATFQGGQKTSDDSGACVCQTGSTPGLSSPSSSSSRAAPASPSSSSSPFLVVHPGTPSAFSSSSSSASPSSPASRGRDRIGRDENERSSSSPPPRDALSALLSEVSSSACRAEAKGRGESEWEVSLTRRDLTTGNSSDQTCSSLLLGRHGSRSDSSLPSPREAAMCSGSHVSHAEEELRELIAEEIERLDRSVDLEENFLNALDRLSPNSIDGGWEKTGRGGGGERQQQGRPRAALLSPPFGKLSSSPASSSSPPPPVSPFSLVHTGLPPDPSPSNSVSSSCSSSSYSPAALSSFSSLSPHPAVTRRNLYTRREVEEHRRSQKTESRHRLKVLRHRRFLWMLLAQRAGLTQGEGRKGSKGSAVPEVAEKKEADVAEENARSAYPWTGDESVPNVPRDEEVDELLLLEIGPDENKTRAVVASVEEVSQTKSARQMDFDSELGGEGEAVSDKGFLWPGDEKTKTRLSGSGGRQADEDAEMKKKKKNDNDGGTAGSSMAPCDVGFGRQNDEQGGEEGDYFSLPASCQEFWVFGETDDGSANSSLAGKKEKDFKACDENFFLRAPPCFHTFPGGERGARGGGDARTALLSIWAWGGIKEEQSGIDPKTVGVRLEESGTEKGKVSGRSSIQTNEGQDATGDEGETGEDTRTGKKKRERDVLLGASERAVCDQGGLVREADRTARTAVEGQGEVKEVDAADQGGEGEGDQEKEEGGERKKVECRDKSDGESIAEAVGTRRGPRGRTRQRIRTAVGGETEEERDVSEQKENRGIEEYRGQERQPRDHRGARRLGAERADQQEGEEDQEEKGVSEEKERKKSFIRHQEGDGARHHLCRETETEEEKKEERKRASLTSVGKNSGTHCHAREKASGNALSREGDTTVPAVAGQVGEEAPGATERRGGEDSGAQAEAARIDKGRARQSEDTTDQDSQDKRRKTSQAEETQESEERKEPEVNEGEEEERVGLLDTGDESIGVVEHKRRKPHAGERERSMESDAAESAQGVNGKRKAEEERRPESTEEEEVRGEAGKRGREGQGEAGAWGEAQPTGEGEEPGSSMEEPSAAHPIERTDSKGLTGDHQSEEDEVEEETKPRRVSSQRHTDEDAVATADGTRPREERERRAASNEEEEEQGKADDSEGKPERETFQVIVGEDLDDDEVLALAARLWEEGREEDVITKRSETTTTVRVSSIKVANARKASSRLSDPSLVSSSSSSSPSSSSSARRMTGESSARKARSGASSAGDQTGSRRRTGTGTDVVRPWSLLDPQPNEQREEWFSSDSNDENTPRRRRPTTLQGQRLFGAAGKAGRGNAKANKEAKGTAKTGGDSPRRWSSPAGVGSGTGGDKERRVGPKGEEEEEEKQPRSERRRSSRLEDRNLLDKENQDRSPNSLDRSSPSQRGEGASPSSRSRDRFAIYRSQVGDPETARRVVNDRHPGAGAACRSQRKWRPTDEQLLVAGVNLFGVGRWNEICKFFPPLRKYTPIQLKDKFRSLHKLLECSGNEWRFLS